MYPSVSPQTVTDPRTVARRCTAFDILHIATI
jgi:hypothetical protein